VALIFSYESDWVTGIQPQGRGFSALRLAFEFYSGLRLLGLDVDIISPGTALDGYQMVVIPSLPILPEGLTEQLAAFAGPVVIGPRTGSKTRSFAIPPNLAPGTLQSLIPIKIVRVESLRDTVSEPGDGFAISRWIEHVETDLTAEETLLNGQGVVFANGTVRYIAGWPDAALLDRVLRRTAHAAGLEPCDLGSKSLRIRRAGDLCFAFNYGTSPVTLSVTPEHAGDVNFIIGSDTIGPAQFAVWRAIAP
jgi:beta-galactosidase